MSSLLNSIRLVLLAAIACQIVLGSTSSPSSSSNVVIDDTKFDRATLAELSKLHAETKDLSSAERCNVFAVKLRELADKPSAKRVDLFNLTIAYLSPRQLPFNNDQPVLEDLKDCLEKHPNDVEREVIAPPGASAAASATTQTTTISPMDEAKKEFKEVRNRVKDSGHDLYHPSKNLSLTDVLRRGTYYRDTSSEIDLDSVSDSDSSHMDELDHDFHDFHAPPVGPLKNGAYRSHHDHQRDHYARPRTHFENEVVSGLHGYGHRRGNPALEVARRLSVERRRLLAMDESRPVTREQLRYLVDSLKELEATLVRSEFVNGLCSFDRNLPENELRHELAEARRRIGELEAVRHASLVAGKWGANAVHQAGAELYGNLNEKLKKVEVLRDLREVALRLYDNIPKHEPLAHRCQKYYMAYNRPSKKATNWLVKTIGQLELPTVVGEGFNPTDRFFDDLASFEHKLRSLSGVVPDTRTQLVLDDLNRCLVELGRPYTSGGNYLNGGDHEFSETLRVQHRRGHRRAPPGPDRPLDLPYINPGSKPHTHSAVDDLPEMYERHNVGYEAARRLDDPFEDEKTKYAYYRGEEGRRHYTNVPVAPVSQGKGHATHLYIDDLPELYERADAFARRPALSPALRNARAQFDSPRDLHSRGNVPLAVQQVREKMNDMKTKHFEENEG